MKELLLKGVRVKQDKDGDEITLNIKLDITDLTDGDLQEFAATTIKINQVQPKLRKLEYNEFIALNGSTYNHKASKPGARSVVDTKEAAKAYLKAQLALGKSIEDILAEMQ